MSERHIVLKTSIASWKIIILQYFLKQSHHGMIFQWKKKEAYHLYITSFVGYIRLLVGMAEAAKSVLLQWETAFLRIPQLKVYWYASQNVVLLYLLVPHAKLLANTVVSKVGYISHLQHTYNQIIYKRIF